MEASSPLYGTVIFRKKLKCGVLCLIKAVNETCTEPPFFTDDPHHVGETCFSIFSDTTTELTHMGSCVKVTKWCPLPDSIVDNLNQIKYHPHTICVQEWQRAH